VRVPAGNTSGQKIAFMPLLGSLADFLGRIYYKHGAPGGAFCMALPYGISVWLAAIAQMPTAHPSDR